MKKKFFVLIALVVVFAIFLAACNRGGGAATTPTPAPATPTPPPTPPGQPTPEPEPVLTSWRQDTSPITLTMALGDAAIAEHMVWGRCEISQFVTYRTGVHLEIESVGIDLMNTLIAANDLHDIIVQGGAPWRDLIEGGLVHQLCALAERYDPEFFDVTFEQIRLWAAGVAAVAVPTVPEGSLWWYPSHAWDMDVLNQWAHTFQGAFTFAVRIDIYEDIGSPDMRTREGFLQAMRDAHAMFPTIDGAPLHSLAVFSFGDTGSWSLDEIVQVLLAIPPVINGNEYFHRRHHPEFREWHDVFRMMFYEGMLTETFIIDDDATVNERFARGEYFGSLLQQGSHTGRIGALHAANPRSTYKPIDAIMNENFDRPLWGAGGIAGWMRLGVASRTQHPERAMRFLSYLLSEEGRKDMYMGIEGVHWNWQDGEAIWVPEIQALVAEGQASMQTVGIAISWSSWLQPAVEVPWLTANRLYRAAGAEPVFSPMDRWADFFAERTPRAQWWTGGLWPPSGSPEQLIVHDVEIMWGTLMPQWLMASTREEMDAIFAQYDAFLESSGFNRVVVPWRTEQLRRNLYNLGMDRVPDWATN